MTDNNNEMLDERIADAFASVKVTDELKASTMAAIHASSFDMAAMGDGDVEGEQRNRRAGANEDVAERRQSSRKNGKGAFFRVHRRLVAGLAAAMLCMAALGVGGNTIVHTETAYASIAAQTQVTLGVNRFGNVVSATSASSDTQDELDALALEGKGYDEAVGILIASGYLGDATVDVEVGADEDGQLQELVATSTACLENAGCSGTCNGNRYGQHNGSGTGNGTGTGSGNGTGNGSGAGTGTGSGSGAGTGTGSSSGAGTGTGSGSGAGTGNGTGDSDGTGSGNGTGHGDSSCTGNGSGSGYGTGDSTGHGSGTGAGA